MSEMRSASFQEQEEKEDEKEEEEEKGKKKPGGELNLTLIFYEYDPRTCNDMCNVGHLQLNCY